MTAERDELILAAKAGGIKLLFDPHGMPRDCTGMHPDMNIFAGKPWNSRESDGDAFRLKAKLRLEVSHVYDDRVLVLTHTKFERGERPMRLEEWLRHANERCDATRRAITRAAAQIGKAMP
jgi:hypothetical protein